MGFAKRAAGFVSILVIGLIGIEIALRLAGQVYLTRLYQGPTSWAANQPEAINVVCLGESSTAGIWVELDGNYPYQLRERLRKHYRNDHINVFVPPHVGQNTSQVRNRVESYIDLYDPALFILMVGYNNGWSLAESNIIHHMQGDSFDVWWLKTKIFIDRFRIYKAARYLYLRAFDFVKGRESGDAPHDWGYPGNTKYILGHPEAKYMPLSWVTRLMQSQNEALLNLWNDDVGHILDEIRSSGSNALLMTYHINPLYLRPRDIQKMAESRAIPWVRNDVAFGKLIREGVIRDYLLHDNWHPNKDGYKIIAENTFASITQNDLLDLDRTRNADEEGPPGTGEPHP